VLSGGAARLGSGRVSSAPPGEQPSPVCAPLPLKSGALICRAQGGASCRVRLSRGGAVLRPESGAPRSGSVGEWAPWAPIGVAPRGTSARGTSEGERCGAPNGERCSHAPAPGAALPPEHRFTERALLRPRPPPRSTRNAGPRRRPLLQRNGAPTNRCSKELALQSTGAPENRCSREPVLQRKSTAPETR
jgi:hypothetical protein